MEVILSQHIFNEEIQSNRQSKRLITIAAALTVLCSILLTIKSIVVSQLVIKKENVSCIPVNHDLPFPYAYHQTIAHPVQSDSRVKSFITEYVHLTKDESYIDYHATTDNSRYDDAKLSKNLWKATEMTAGIEKALIQKKYVDSVDVFKFLKANNVGWVFLVDSILVHPLEEAGSYRIVVRGEYQVTYDKAKVDIPHGLLGYKELTYILVQADPTEDMSGNDLNKSGLFIVYSQEDTLTFLEKQRLDQKDINYYMNNRGF